MKLFKFGSLALFLAFLFFLNPQQSNAQVGQMWETFVGADPGGGSGGSGGNTGPGPGVFRPPFKCRLTYVGSTYGPIPGNPDGHTPYAVDFNGILGRNDLGEPVRASANGRVSETRYFVSNGQITISHAGGYATLYAHMLTKFVNYNDTVRVGQVIGTIGDRGNVTGPHLHYGLYRNNIPIRVTFGGRDYPASLPSLPYGQTRAGPPITGPCP